MKCKPHRGARLGEAVALTKWAAEAGLHEDLRLTRERRRAANHDADPTANQLLDLLEDSPSTC